jgi:hypothetical protein
VQVVRAVRATTTGRSASPRRPYALSGRLRCAACGRYLIGDTGYYRHNDACDAFKLATPDRPPGWHGRRDGKGYRREEYEAVVGELLERVSLGANVVARVVEQLATSDGAPDHVALRRIDHDRTAAAQRVLRDRDYEALKATMERLDREETEARQPRESQGVPAKAAVRYLRGLGKTWRLADGGRGRKELVDALFEGIDVLGLREVVVHLTPRAIANGFQDAIPGRVDITVGYGRGERI